MKIKNIFNSEEVKCIKKMFILASLAKYSMMAVWINLIPLIVFVINDFIRYSNNLTRNFLGKYFYLTICVIVIMLILFGISYIILGKNLANNKIWQNILEKADNEENINTKVENTKNSIKSTIPAYLLGNTISKSKNFKNIGNAVKIGSGIIVSNSMINSCSIIINFIKNISKTYNIPLRNNDKLYLILFILPALIIIPLDISTTIKDIQIGNNLKNDVINSLKEKCNKKEYCNSILTSYDDTITIIFNEEPDIGSRLELNENRKVKSILTYLTYNKNLRKEDIINDVNKKLEQLVDLINSSNVECEYDFICKKYQLSDEFINKFYIMSDDDIDGRNTRHNYELENKYELSTFAYIVGDQYSNPTDELKILFGIN